MVNWNTWSLQLPAKNVEELIKCISAWKMHDLLVSTSIVDTLVYACQNSSLSVNENIHVQCCNKMGQDIQGISVLSSPSAVIRNYLMASYSWPMTYFQETKHKPFLTAWLFPRPTTQAQRQPTSARIFTQQCCQQPALRGSSNQKLHRFSNLQLVIYFIACSIAQP